MRYNWPALLQSLRALPLADDKIIIATASQKRIFQFYWLHCNRASARLLSLRVSKALQNMPGYSRRFELIKDFFPIKPAAFDRCLLIMQGQSLLAVCSFPMLQASSQAAVLLTVLDSGIKPYLAKLLALASCSVHKVFHIHDLFIFFPRQWRDLNSLIQAVNDQAKAANRDQEFLTPARLPDLQDADLDWLLNDPAITVYHFQH